MARIIRTEINAKIAWHLADTSPCRSPSTQLSSTTFSLRCRSAPVDTVLQLYSEYKKVHSQLRATARSQWHEFW
eukprot:COSAG01_NODE_3523_length_5972_cov_2.681307_7_plen_74_part_00